MRRECAGGLGDWGKGLKRNRRRGSRRADRGTYEAGQSCQLARLLLRARSCVVRFLKYIHVAHGVAVGKRRWERRKYLRCYRLIAKI